MDEPSQHWFLKEVAAIDETRHMVKDWCYSYLTMVSFAFMPGCEFLQMNRKSCALSGIVGH